MNEEMAPWRRESEQAGAQLDERLARLASLELAVSDGLVDRVLSAARRRSGRGLRADDLREWARRGDTRRRTLASSAIIAGAAVAFGLQARRARRAREARAA
jgi:hypothetical protein